MKRRRNTLHLHHPCTPCPPSLPHRTSFAALASTVGGLFDRSNEQVQKTQDIIVNGGFFVLSCYIIYQYGHKLAV